jgi:hypothetical protein
MIVAELVGATICLLALLVGVGALWIYRPDRAGDLQRVSDEARGLVRSWAEESGKRLGVLEVEVARLAARSTAPTPPADGSTMLPPPGQGAPSPARGLPSLPAIVGDEEPPSRSRTIVGIAPQGRGGVLPPPTPAPGAVTR